MCGDVQHRRKVSCCGDCFAESAGKLQVIYVASERNVAIVREFLHGVNYNEFFIYRSLLSSFKRVIMTENIKLNNTKTFDRKKTIKTF